MDLSGKRVLVMGLARSGRSAARLAAAHGARVVAIDLRTGLDPIDGVVLELGPHRRERFEEADILVVSPGIPAAQPDVDWALSQGKDVVGELGFALRFLPELAEHVLAITGTNGKSTTTHFLGQLLQASGYTPFVGGNLGTPLCEAALQPKGEDVLVLEVSSYQLELPGALAPRVGAILNLTPDHLGRHGTMVGYAEAKAKLFAKMGPMDFAVLPWGDPLLVPASSETHAQRLWLGAHPGVVRSGRTLELQISGRDPVKLSLQDFAVPGEHNLDNAGTAALMAIAYGADPAAIQAALPELKPLAHRMQVVAQGSGVTWIDDSKATNIDAARVGIGGLEGRAVVLLGGQGKPNPDGSLGFEVLASALARHRAVVTFGQDGPVIQRELCAQPALTAVGLEVQCVPRLCDAVDLAARLAEPGEIVLLSPGCASFDEFRDFEHRGEQFAQWARAKAT